MTRSKRLITMVFSMAAMAILIFDSRTALNGMAEGIDLCLKVVIPSLFPFLILSVVLTASALGMKLGFLVPLCRLCRIPSSAAPLLLVGFIGGYPVGAQSVTNAWQCGNLSDTDAKRMLGFCSNAGPAFIFGMTAGLFSSAAVPWALWLVQMTAALLTGILLPGEPSSDHKPNLSHSLSPAAVLHQSVGAMASICGWVIIFRTLLCYGDRWILPALPQYARCMIAGVLELTNGCCRLVSIPSESLRFLFCSGFLAFGGIGVYMQTMSVTPGLGTGSYLQGKLMQTALAVILSCSVCPVLFSTGITAVSLLGLGPLAVFLIFSRKILPIRKNNSRNLTVQRV